MYPVTSCDVTTHPQLGTPKEVISPSNPEKLYFHRDGLSQMGPILPVQVKPSTFREPLQDPFSVSGKKPRSFYPIA